MYLKKYFPFVSRFTNLLRCAQVWKFHNLLTSMNTGLETVFQSILNINLTTPRCKLPLLIRHGSSCITNTTLFPASYQSHIAGCCPEKNHPSHLRHSNCTHCNRCRYSRLVVNRKPKRSVFYGESVSHLSEHVASTHASKRWPRSTSIYHKDGSWHSRDSDTIKKPKFQDLDSDYLFAPFEVESLIDKRLVTILPKIVDFPLFQHFGYCPVPSNYIYLSIFST